MKKYCFFLPLFILLLTSLHAQSGKEPRYTIVDGPHGAFFIDTVTGATWIYDGSLADFGWKRIIFHVEPYYTQREYSLVPYGEVKQPPNSETKEEPKK